MSTHALDQILRKVRSINDIEIGWTMEGGRSCPIGWEDCSQPVFESNCGRYTDHGERGGPGDHHCRTQCHHGYQPPDDED